MGFEKPNYLVVHQITKDGGVIKRVIQEGMKDGDDYANLIPIPGQDVVIKY